MRTHATCCCARLMPRALETMNLLALQSADLGGGWVMYLVHLMAPMFNCKLLASCTWLGTKFCPMYHDFPWVVNFPKFYAMDLAYLAKFRWHEHCVVGVPMKTRRNSSTRLYWRMWGWKIWFCDHNVMITSGSVHAVGDWNQYCGVVGWVRILTHLNFLLSPRAAKLAAHLIDIQLLCSSQEAHNLELLAIRNHQGKLRFIPWASGYSIFCNWTLGNS